MRIPCLPLLGLVTLSLYSSLVSADWEVPAGSTIDLGAGSVSLGCADLRNSGNLLIGPGGSVVDARNAAVLPGATLTLNGGRVELAQTWSNQGTVTATAGGEVRRMASAGCAVVGLAGVIPLGAGPTPSPIPSSSPISLILLAAALTWFGIRAQRTSSKT